MIVQKGGGRRGTGDWAPCAAGGPGVNYLQSYVAADETGIVSDRPGSPGGATVSLRVDGLDAVVADLRAKGATVSDVTTGAHERRAEVQDPAGNQLVLYESA